MEPIPETAEALDELDAPDDAGVRLRHLTALAARAKQVVPDLVGVSLTRIEQGLTFTLVATDAEVAVLDGVQYVAGGPCVDGAHADEVYELEVEDALDEERWRRFAEATAARGVRSTLTLPVVGEDEEVLGTVNLYAASRRAFGGHREELAEIFGAWAAGAMLNADLSFTTRQEAEAAPERIREREVIEAASAVLAFERDIDLEAAEESLRDAAARAGVTAADLARDIVSSWEEDEDDEPSDREGRHDDDDSRA